MNDDDLLKRLGAVAREQRSAQPDRDAPSLDADARARIADRLATQVSKPTTTAAAPEKRGRVFAFVAGGLALAAALVLVLRRPGGQGEEGTAFPAYTFDDSAVAAKRGPGPGSVTAANVCNIHANDHASFLLVARPDEPIAKVDAFAFVVRGREVTPWKTGPELSESGAVKLAGPTHVLVDVDELRLVVGRGLTAEAAKEKATSLASRGSGWQLLRCGVVR